MSDTSIQLTAQPSVTVTIYNVTNNSSIDVILKGESTALIPHLTRLVTDALTPEDSDD